jgi:hypothetical protein
MGRIQTISTHPTRFTISACSPCNADMPHGEADGDQGLRADFHLETELPVWSKGDPLLDKSRTERAVRRASSIDNDTIKLY